MSALRLSEAIFKVKECKEVGCREVRTWAEPGVEVIAGEIERCLMPPTN